MGRKKREVECNNFDTDDFCKVTGEPCPAIDSSCPYFELPEENEFASNEDPDDEDVVE